MFKKLGPWQFIKSLYHIIAGKPSIPASLDDNTLLHTILNRRSVRRFSDQPISQDVFDAILEAGRLAPSTVNLQTWTFAVFSTESWRETFGRPIPFTGQRAVIVMTDTRRNKAIAEALPYSPLIEYTLGVTNASLAAMNMNLAAEALGISSIMLSETGRGGFLDAAFLKEKMNLPERVIPLMTIVFGYATGRYPPMPPKLPLDQICFEGHYRETDNKTMEEWLSQMMAGYKASHLRSSFETQLKVYQNKMEKAESDLQAMVFHDGGKT